MNTPGDAVSRFYHRHLPGLKKERGRYSAPCPLCQEDGKQGRITIHLNPKSFFHGFFQCTSNCVPGGYSYWFATLLRVDTVGLPGGDMEGEPEGAPTVYPLQNVNHEMAAYQKQVTADLTARFDQMGVEQELLNRLHIGFNGRYITYPYIQQNGNCYSLRCVHPDKEEDFFWHGNEQFSQPPYQLFNVQELSRCRGGALFLVEGEENLLVLKQLGYPGVAIPHRDVLETLDAEIFTTVTTLFIVTRNNAESEDGAKRLASRIGFKVRLLHYKAGTDKDIDLAALAVQNPTEIRRQLSLMIQHSAAFSPFATPQHEYATFQSRLAERKDDKFLSRVSGFGLLDERLQGLHGINILGGAPKVGKSAFAIQLATFLAEHEMPVLYYDFENGRQQLYQRILCRLSRVVVEKLSNGVLEPEEKQLYEKACERMQNILNYLRVINDRKLTPELMRRHIDFIQHETRNRYVTVVIDSLHKLPFKDITERRTGIDAWLRELESIRDQQQAAFLVLSELSRGDEKPYSDTPHLGIFKGSGDIEYSADNALVLQGPARGLESSSRDVKREALLWLVASRTQTPGVIASYSLDYPYWGFVENTAE